VSFEILYSEQADEQLTKLQRAKGKKAVCKAVEKAILFLAANPKHPSLNTHEFTSLKGPDGMKVFEAYAQNNTPDAYRIFFCYHPPKTDSITIIDITPHP
jgi:hypothetical protein